MLATDIERLCRERDWKRAQLLLRLRSAARRRVPEVELPGDESLRRMVREWASGRRQLSPLYADLLSQVFEVQFSCAESDVRTDAANELAERFSRVQTIVDTETISLFEGQTQSFRMLDRRLGAARLLVQCEAHVTQMSDLLAYCMPGDIRTLLAKAVAEAAALAGWQALDLGRPDKAWTMHEIAKSTARESGDPSVIAHVTAQQAYALLDLKRPADARRQIIYARREAGTRIPRLMRSWLWAAQAEACAADGDATGTMNALEQATQVLPGQADADLAYLFLDPAHLARWRGHCLARIGAEEAVADLTAAVAAHDATFARAAAGLYVDLALAHAVRGERAEAKVNATQAARLADITSSMRQKRRITQLLAAVSG